MFELDEGVYAFDGWNYYKAKIIKREVIVL
jgi:hypothetical protein